METTANCLIQDENLDIRHNGVTPLGKTNVSKPAKKGGLGAKKALNDISNSRKTSVPQLTKKDNFTSIISIEKNFGAGEGFSKVPKKGKVVGRKALGDLTNSAKQSSQQALKMGQKLKPVSENVTRSMVEERFLHNHHECSKAQKRVPGMDFFLKSTGLYNDIPLCPSAKRGVLSPAKKPESNMRRMEMEEIPELLFADEARRCKKSELLGYCSPAIRSPKSPKQPYMNWEDDSISDLMLIATP